MTAQRRILRQHHQTGGRQNRMHGDRRRWLRVERLEARIMLHSDVIISEVVASNLNDHLDFFDSDPDWFEVHNRGPSAVNLQGWSVTDDLLDLAKWRVPQPAFIQPDERLVIYASGRDTVATNGELHTNFSLDEAGEGLALVEPGGLVVHSFQPAFPTLATNVSYGFEDQAVVTSLVETGATATAFVPTDGSLNSTWTGGNEPFNDSGWISGSTGVGYDSQGLLTNLAPPIAYWTFDEVNSTVTPDARGRYDGTVVGATLTTGGLGRFGEALSFDGDDDYVIAGVIEELRTPDTFTISTWFFREVDHAAAADATKHNVNNVLIAQASDASNDNLEFGTEGDSIEVFLKTGERAGTTEFTQAATVTDNQWHHLVVTYDMAAENELKFYLDGSLVGERSEPGGLVVDNVESPFTIGMSRPNGSALGDFEGLIDDVAVWDTALDQSHVSGLFAGSSPLALAGYATQIGLDLQAEMFNQNSSAYVRVPFTVANPDDVEMLRLRMKYDDAFVAYVNGHEIARRNFGGPPNWNSVAGSDRPDTSAFNFDELTIPVFEGLVQAGENILAVQLVNDSPVATRAILVPELESVQLLYRRASLIDHAAPRAVLVPQDNSLGTAWTGGNEPFDANGWFQGTDGIGYETGQVGSPVPGPVAYWTFDELTGNGGLLPDQFGQYDGTVVGATLTTGGLGRFGEALTFDGDDDYVTMGVIEELRTPDAFSVSVWFLREADHNSTLEATSHNINNVLIAQAANGAKDNLEIGTEGTSIELFLDTEDKVGVASEFTQTATVMEDQWHHLVVTYDSSAGNELKFFLDGSLVGERSEPGGLVIDNVTSPFTIGLSRPGGSAWGDFEGLIDDVAIWEAALDAQHVAALWSGVAPPLAAGPVYAEHIRIDLQTELLNQQSSAYLRIPFTVDDPDAVLSIDLNLQYDDAHVTYINGFEVARSNVSGTPAFDSVADADRPDIAGLFAERFVLTDLSGVLQPGENILAIHGLNAAQNADRFLVRPELTATYLPGTLLSYMDAPTPAAANAIGFVGLAPPPGFSIPGGTFTNTINLELTAASPASEIRYTTDGELPTETSLLYAAPIEINQTTQIRARVFHPGLVPSDIDSESYTRLGVDLANYLGSGSPFASDVPVVVFDAYGQSISEGPFRNIGFSLFEPQNGSASIADSVTVGTRAGLRVRGSSSAGFAKKPYALELRRDDSDDDLNLSLLGMSTEADWVLQGPYEFDRSLNRNRVIYDLSNQVDRTAMRTQYIEVFLNTSGDLTFSDYVGIYVLIEKIERDPGRIDIDKLSTQMTTEPDITGGYIFKVDRLDPGDSGFSAGGQQWAYVEPKESDIEGHTEQRTYLSNYIGDFISALNRSDFTHAVTGQHYSELVDVDSLVDHHLLNLVTINVDAFVLSAYWFKPREGKLEAGPIWDFDRSIESNDSRDDNPLNWFLTPGFGPTLWTRVFHDLEFRQKFIDRWSEMRRGALSDANIESTIDSLRAELGSDNPATGEPDAVTRNFARWPQVRPRSSGGYASGMLDGTWQGEIAHQKAWLFARTNWIDSLFVSAPVIDPIGGSIVPPQTLTITGPQDATIYYTIDGSDPRLPGGGVSPAAIEYTAPIDINISMTVTARSFHANYNVPISNFNVSVNNREEWSGITVAPFQLGTLSISEINYHPHDATDAEKLIDPTLVGDDVEFVELQYHGPSTFDLSGVQFTDGIQFDFTGSQVTSLSPGDRVLVVQDQSAFEARYGSGQNSRIAGEYSGQLANSGEQLTLVNFLNQVLQKMDYTDDDPWPRLADGFGGTLEIIDPLGDEDDPFNWRLSTEYGGTPGDDGIGPPDSVVINELVTNPAGQDDDAIELHNPTGSDLDISGWWLSDRLDELDRYVFPGNTQIDAGSYLVLGSSVIGFGLSANQGEDIVLVEPDVTGNPVRFIGAATFGPAAVGVSFGLWPDAVGNLFPMTATTLGTANAGPRFGPLILSEVLYHPADPGDGSDAQLLEFLEIFNPTVTPVALDGWTIDGISYSFPLGKTIDPGQLLVLVPFDPLTDTERVAAFNRAYKVDIQNQTTEYLGPYPGRLRNSGERLTLQRDIATPAGNPSLARLVIEDQVTFDDVDPWPTTADGNGGSLQRVRIDAWGDDATSWLRATPSPGRFGPTVSFASPVVTNVIGEVGMFTDITHEVRTVNLSRTYSNPVVFALPASFNGTEPTIVRVSDVQPDRFDMFLVEPSDKNGLHGVGETVSYLVLEAGRHILTDGTQLEVGIVSTSATVGVSEPIWKTVDFSSTFDAAPVIFSQPQTVADQTFLSTRHDAITATGFQLALEPEQLVDVQNGVESVGYLAMESSSGIWNESAYDVRTTDPMVGDVFASVTFATPFSVTPALVASLATYEGADNAHLRFQNLGTEGVELKTEEDTTVDTELNHKAESVAYLAVGGQGQLTALNTLPDNQVQSHSIAITDAGRIDAVKVTLDLFHTRIEDLDVFLEGPDGTTEELFTDVGGDGADLLGATLDDGAAQSITAGLAPFSGIFQPEGSLTAYLGMEIAGTWILHITDDTPNDDIGALQSWSLEFDLAAEPEGNVNHDSQLDAHDIDLLFASLGSGNAMYDLDHDGDTDVADVDQLVLNIMGKRFGDADLDNDVDINDFNGLLGHYDPLGKSATNGWAAGNFNGDNRIDISDFNILVMNFAPLGYLQAVLETSAVDQAVTIRAHAKPTAASDRLQIVGSDSATSKSSRKTRVQLESRDHRQDDPTRWVIDDQAVDQYFRAARKKRSVVATLAGEENA